MGKVVVKMKLINLRDFFARDEGRLNQKPRELEAEALVDTGATRLYLKSSLIQQLGLHQTGTVLSHTTNGKRVCGVYDPVHLELMGRSGNFDVVEVDDSVPNLLGQIPLEYLDFVVNSKSKKLQPNPEYGGQWMSEEF